MADAEVGEVGHDHLRVGEGEAGVQLEAISGGHGCRLPANALADTVGQPTFSRSAPTVVSSPCPVCTTVSSGSANNRFRIEPTSTSASL